MAFRLLPFLVQKHINNLIRHRWSEGAHVSAQRASKKELLTVRVGEAQRALVLTGAHGDSRFGLLREVVTLLLLCVAVVAEVCLAPAVPRGDSATELALPLEEVLTVRGALRGGRRAAAPAAHEVRGVERLVILPCVAPSLPGEVGVRALGAHKVGVPVHGVPLPIVVPLACGVDELLRFGEPLELEALEGFLLDCSFQLADGLEVILQGGVVNRDLAQRALRKPKRNTSSRPPFLQFVFNAHVVKRMATLETHGGC